MRFSSATSLLDFFFRLPSGVGGRVSARECTDHTSKGGARPTRMRIRMQRPSSQRGAPGSHSQDTVRQHHTLLDRRPKLRGRPPRSRGLQFCSATPEGCPLRVTPTGPLRGGAAASTPQHFGFFVPRRSALVGTPPVPKHTAPAPVYRRGTHSGGCPTWPSQF